MKKILKHISALIICTLLAVCIMPATASAADVAKVDSSKCGDNLTWSIDGDTLTISGTGDMYSYEEYINYAPWYGKRKNIKSVVIEEGVTSIGARAFYYCESFTSITIPESVTSIGEEAFRNCFSLRSITIPNSVTSIGDYAFYYCDSLTSITIPNSVTSIGERTFYYCGSLTSITIPNSVTSIGEGAFSECTSLISITIPNSVTSIGEEAFRNCFSLRSITIPNSVTSIGDYAFYDCESFTSITIPESVTSIGEGVFSGCDSLKSVTIPEGVTSIGDSAFHGCIFTSITIPNSVKSIGNRAFAFCYYLTKITIPEGVTSIGDGTFEFCNYLTSITIPKSVTSIGDYAFSYCKSLTSITIPNSVTSIGDYVFASCSSLASITIPEGVTSIGDGTFEYCGSLKIITIPNSVKSIGDRAFYYCKSLKSITIPNSVKSIGDWAFAYCDALTSIKIPYSVTDIFGHAFGTMEDIYYAGTIAEWKNISECVITKATVHCADGNYKDERDIQKAGRCGENVKWILPNDGVLTIKGTGEMFDYSYDEGKTDTPFKGLYFRGIVIEEGVTSIGDYAFYDCESFTSITIPESVTSIGEGTFKYCDSLTSITIPEGVTSIRESAFENCTSLTSITIPNSVTSIGEKAFRNCFSLRSITIPKGVTSIDYFAFGYCKSLTSITIPEGVTSIGDSAFYICDSLTSIAIPNSVKYIGYWAFSCCDSLTDVYYAGSKETWGDISIGGENTYLINATIHYGKCDIKIGSISNGTVTVDKAVATAGETVTVTATPADGYKLDAIYVDGQKIAGNTFTVTGDHTVTAEFVKVATVTVKNVQNGTVTVNKTTPSYGETVTVTAIPADGYKLEAIYVDGQKIAGNTFIVTGDHTVTAKFIIDNPVVIADSAPSGKPYISWTEVRNADEYQVWRSTKETSGYVLVRTVLGTNYEDTNTAKGTTYYYKVRANLANGKNSEFSNVVKVTVKSAAPTGVKATNDAATGSPKIRWNKVDGAVKYQVWRSTAQNGKYYLMNTVTGTSLINKSALAGKLYYYKVVAVDAKGNESAASAVVQRTADLAKVTGVKATNDAATGKPVIRWNKVDGAAGYKVYRSTAQNGTYGLMGTYTGTTMTNKNAVAGKLYYYKVMAVHSNANANGAYSAVVQRTADLAQVTNLKITNDAATGKPKLTWNAVEGAVSYKVYRSTAQNGTYSLMGTYTGTTMTNKNAVAGKTYYYKVMAVHSNANANSVYSAVASRMCDLARPTVTVKIGTTGKPVLSWNKVDGAVKYEIYRSRTGKDGSFALINTVTGTSTINENAVKGKKYFYKVIAVHSNTNANSAYSTVVSVTSK